MTATDTMDSGHDKHWAKRYILDPLTAPEPSQETGLGTSHYNRHVLGPARPTSPASPARPISIARPKPHPSNLPNSSPRHHPKSPSPRRNNSIRRRRTNNSDSDDENGLVDPFADCNSVSNFFNNPTPPDSADKTFRLPHHYHPSNPYSPLHSRRVSSPLDTHAEEATTATPPRSPPPHLAGLAQYHRYRQPLSPSSSNGLNRTTSARAPNSSRPNHAALDHNRSRSASYNDPKGKSVTETSNTHRRPSGSPPLMERYPGDMSHRPLDMLKRDSRTADRRHRKRFSETDTIDLLDTIGPAYHHGGPFDATLASRNQNKKYSPVEAVRDSNMAALRATPREYIADSLKRHHPLQGTSSIPPGESDLSGNVMNYEEGADLMREPDAEGGPYKRWDDIKYHPDDLKGKGEPSFTYDRDKKDQEARAAGLSRTEYEMQSSPLMGSHRSSRRARASTYGGEASAPVTVAAAPEGSSSGVNKPSEQTEVSVASVGRRNSTHKISDGLKRRFGSLRRRKGSGPEAE